MAQQNQLNNSLIHLFGEQRVKQCKETINAETTFTDLHCPGLSLQGFELHQKLLDGYFKLQAMKKNNRALQENQLNCHCEQSVAIYSVVLH